MSDKDYVVRLMKARCSCGTMDNYLNVEKDHGVLAGAEQQPLLNANDHIAEVNVIHFGSCKSDGNPELNARKGIVGAIIGGGLLGPAGILLGGVISDKLEDVGIIDCKCKPQTPMPWIKGNEEHIIEGAPALMACSTLACKYGGVITIVQEEADEAVNENKTSEEAPQEEPQEDIVAEGVADAFAEAKAQIATTGEAGVVAVTKANNTDGI